MKTSLVIFVLLFLVTIVDITSAQPKTTNSASGSAQGVRTVGDLSVHFGVSDAQLYGPGHRYRSYILQFGTHQSATTCYDAPLNETDLGPTPVADIFHTRFSLPCDADSGTFGSYIDIRPYTISVQVDTYLVRVEATYPIVLSWPDLASLYAGPVSLKDRILGGILLDVDMKSQNSVKVSIPSLKEFYIIATGPSADSTIQLVIPPPSDFCATTDADSITFGWKRSPFEREYVLQVSTDDLFSTMVHEDSLIRDPFETVGGLIDGGEYFARLRAKTQFGFTNWTPTTRFRTNFDSVQVQLDAGWNLVSVGIMTDSTLPASLFPSRTSNAWEFTPVGYNVVSDLHCGKGYWLRFGDSLTNTQYGYPILASSIPVVAGWNLIGSISGPTSIATIVPTGTSILTSYYGYRQAYATADTLEPGRGYWVKVDADGYLGLDPQSAVPRSIPIAGDLSEFNKLTIRDAAGREQSLSFGLDPTTRPHDRVRFDLPPIPPSGGFDVRFTSGRMVEFLGAGGEQSLPISISSARFPITISWEMKAGNGPSVTIRSADVESPMTGRGSISVLSPSKISVVSSGGAAVASVPMGFSLDQNYPNPFNPATTISFIVAESPAGDAALLRVTLKVYDVLGRTVATLVDNERAPGRYSVAWDASNHPGGIYYYRLTAGSFTESKKLVLLK